MLSENGESKNKEIANTFNDHFGSTDDSVLIGLKISSNGLKTSQA